MMDEATIRIAIRTTARISFLLFLCAFLGDALCQLWPAAITHWLKHNRDRFTLGLAASHTVHLAFILLLVATLGREHLLEELGWGVFISFTTGFLLIYALAAGVLLPHRTFWLTSTRFVASAHYFLIVLFGFAFALSGLTNPFFYAPFVLTAAAALGIRVSAAVRSRKVEVVRRGA